MTERIKTNFMDNQARDLSAPGLDQGKKRIILAVVIVAVSFGLFQVVQFFLNLSKQSALRTVAVTLTNPGMLDGVANVDVTVNNMNPTSVSKIAFRYNIIGPNGSTVASDVVTIPDAVPAGDHRTFPHVKLGPLKADAARMQADIVDMQMGPKSALTSDQENTFIDIASMKDEEKEQQCRQFIQQVPTFIPAYIQLAHSFMARTEYDKAIKVLKTAVEKDPKNGDAHYNLALCLQHKGDKAEAGKELRQALDLMPDDPNIQSTAQHFDGE